MRLRRFVLLDRDGTLIVHHPYLSNPAAVELLPGVVEGLAKLRELGLGLIVVTNQSGVGRHYITLDAVRATNDRLEQLLDVHHQRLDDIFVCPHAPDDACSCRKPGTKLVQDAASKWGFDPRDSFVIGDAPCDIDLGKAIGAVTVRMVRSTSAESWPEALVADYTASDLVQAAAFIARQL